MRFYIVLVGVALLVLGPLEVLVYLHPPDGREHAAWLQFIGRFHSLVVHLPICLIVLVPVLEAMARFKRWQGLRPAAGMLLALATVATVAAVVIGGFLAYSGGYAGRLVEQHMWGGIGLVFICTVALALRAWMLRTPTAAATSSYGLALTLGLGLLAWTGHQGGSLTHGDGYLTQQMPARLKLALGIKEQRVKASPGQPADAFYLTHIQPVFDDSCVVCHGSRKKKGGLNMESYADLVKGGENGPVVAVANVEKSELYRRITLAGDHKEFMPSEGKKPLSKEQVLLIKQWIASGASPNKTLADLQREGIEVAAVAVAASPAAPDHRKFAAQIAALEAKLHVRLVPVSQTVTDGLILRTVNEPGKIDDATLAQLAPVAPLIVDAELARTRVTDRSLTALAAFDNLRRLDLAHTAVTSAVLTALKPLRHLHTINLVGTAVDDSGAAALRGIGSLREVYGFGSKMSERTLAELQAALNPPPAAKGKPRTNG